MSLERRKPLRADPAKTRAWQQRSRKPLPKIGRKAKREENGWEACKATVRARSHGDCEAWRAVVDAGVGIEPRVEYQKALAAFLRSGCSVERHAALDPHHVWPEDRRRGVHDPGRVLDLCRRAHDWTHDHPALAARLGLLRPDRAPVP